MIHISSTIRKKMKWHSIISKNVSGIDYFFNDKLIKKRGGKKENKIEVRQHCRIYCCFNDDERTPFCFNILQLNNYNHSITFLQRLLKTRKIHIVWIYPFFFILIIQFSEDLIFIDIPFFFHFYFLCFCRSDHFRP